MWNFFRSDTALIFLVAVSLIAADKTQADDQGVVKQTYRAIDSLDSKQDEIADANACLNGLCWKPVEFEVTCQTPAMKGDRLVQFPSPVPSGNAINDVVSMEWYQPLDELGNVKRSPAIVIVHESGSNMAVGRLFASALREMGFHTFMIQLPYYGLRRPKEHNKLDASQVAAMKQGVADVRRARDAVAVLPEVDSTTIALQGTSLGGFVSTTAASLDGKYDAVFLMLTGGDLYDILQNGAKDAAKARERLAQQGLVGEALKNVVQLIEPTRIAHRLNPQYVWLYSGIYDTVVPQRNSIFLANTIQLETDHHIQFPINHYTGAIFLPVVFDHIRNQLNQIHALKNQP